VRARLESSDEKSIFEDANSDRLRSRGHYSTGLSRDRGRVGTSRIRGSGRVSVLSPGNEKPRERIQMRSPGVPKRLRRPRSRGRWR
jgi:hypothetical protein